jgi:dihydroxyacetone kinase-like protein
MPLSTAMDAAIIARWLQEIAGDVHARAEHLSLLDAAIGDGDHGINMDRGFTAVDSALAGAPVGAGPGPLLVLAGKTLVSTVGGASGPLWGSFFRGAGRALGEEPTPDGPALAAALGAGLAAVQDLGAAAVGEKTMVDALAPAVDALRERAEGGVALPEAAAEAAEAALEGARATIPLQARKGRASYLGERSIGHEDPGAASAALVFAALSRALA